MSKIPAFLTIFSTFILISVSISIAGDSAKNPTDGNQTKVDKKDETSTKITWVKYDEGLKQAKKEKKKLMVEFTAKWCGYCKKMHATTFKDPDIIKTLGEYFITASVDGESRDTVNVDGWITNGRSLAKEFQIRGYPTYWFFTPEGEKIAPVRGYRSSTDLGYVLDFIKDDLYKTKNFDQYVRERQSGK